MRRAATAKNLPTLTIHHLRPCAYLQRPNSSFIKLLAVQDERGPRKKTKESSHSSRGEERELTRKENLDGNYSFLKSVSNRK